MRKILTSLAICSAISLVHANPTGPTVIAGDDFSFTPDGNTLDVSTSSSRSIVDWESFSVGIYDTLNFNLPDSSSAILNRVTEEVNSDILGQINSNGAVYLVNPYGIIIGNDATINTQTFLASTLDADNGEFLAGNDMTFTGTADENITLVNYGTITADGGDVVLLSYQVSQQGDIFAEEGTAAVGAGTEIVLQVFDTDARIAIVPHSAMSTVSLGVDMGGYIQAVKAELKADGNAYTTAVNHVGWVDAQGLLTQDSAVVFSAPDGLAQIDGGLITSWDASGNKGGYVSVSGDEVNVTASSTITAVGPNEGGQVYIGGGFNGQDPDILNATTTTMSGTIEADGQYQGGGGIVVVWSSGGSTTFDGTITARGGIYQGDGGIVEVAAGGGGSLSFTGSVDVTHRDQNGSDGYLITFP